MANADAGDNGISLENDQNVDALTVRLRPEDGAYRSTCFSVAGSTSISAEAVIAIALPKRLRLLLRPLQRRVQARPRGGA